MDYIEDWSILEADFTREYGIDLTAARISWRRFVVLANGLSKNSVWVMTYSGRKDGSIAIDNDDHGERIMDKFFG